MPHTAIGWILLFLAAFLALAVLFPVTVTVEVKAGGRAGVWVRFLALRVRVFPLRKRNRTEKRKKKPADAQAPAAQEGVKDRPSGIKIAAAKRLARAVIAALRPFLRHLRIHGLRLVVPVCARQAADTALWCARVHAAIGALYAALAGRLHITCRQIQVLPDFAGSSGARFFFSCKFTFCPAILFIAAYRFLVAYLGGARKGSASSRLKARAGESGEVFLDRT